ncbi:hypothetical protein [Stutzerimonas zhaodongensis]|uniref:hypothetical protein n=1 Tax=Stutzerimonas zhaodongensis TaxID=1176257 RepID=UPI00210586C7|nr:hypothetical protein [Stutzerimonas zhaodongensis]MCQ2029748.1 hypothetical protein [Stutzerimonas zhaodongensis]
MDSSDQTRQTLVYADGYSYTEIFQAPKLSGMPGARQLVSVFHAVFTPESENDAECSKLGIAQHAVKPLESRRSV